MAVLRGGGAAAETCLLFSRRPGQRSAPPPFSQAAAFFSTLASAACTSLAAVCASSSVSSASRHRKCRRKGRRDTPRQRRVGGLSPANAALYGALRAAEARFYRAFGNGKSGCDLADAHFEIIVHQHAFALYIGQGGSERGGETAVLLAVERLVRQDLHRAVDKRRGVGLLGRGVPAAARHSLAAVLTVRSGKSSSFFSSERPFSTSQKIFRSVSCARRSSFSIFRQ